MSAPSVFRPVHALDLALQRRRLTAGVLGGGLLISMSLLGAGPARAADAPMVPVMVLGERAVGAGLVMDGSLQAVQQSVLSAQASGRIASLNVKAGDRVKAGQVLAVIDDRATQAGVAQAQTGVAQA